MILRLRLFLEFLAFFGLSVAPPLAQLLQTLTKGNEGKVIEEDCVPVIKSPDKITIGDAQIDMGKYEKWGQDNSKIAAGAYLIKPVSDGFTVKRQKNSPVEKLKNIFN